MLTFIFTSCKKYPEDPFISFRQPYKRLAGTWQITSYQINGVDHSHDFDSLLYPNTLTNCLMFFSNRGPNSGDYSIADNNGHVLFISSGEYGVNRDKTIGFDGAYLYSSIEKSTKFYFQFWKLTVRDSFSSNITNWNIRELYSKTLHLSLNGTDIHFKKQ